MLGAPEYVPVCAATTAAAGLCRIVGQQHEIEIAGRNFRSQSTRVLHPAHQPRPVVRPNRMTGNAIDLPRLDQRDRLEQLVQRAEPPGKMTNASQYLMNIVFRTKK